MQSNIKPFLYFFFFCKQFFHTNVYVTNLLLNLQAFSPREENNGSSPKALKVGWVAYSQNFCYGQTLINDCSIFIHLSNFEGL